MAKMQVIDLLSCLTLYDEAGHQLTLSVLMQYAVSWLKFDHVSLVYLSLLWVVCGTNRALPYYESITKKAAEINPRPTIRQYGVPMQMLELIMTIEMDEHKVAVTWIC